MEGVFKYEICSYPPAIFENHLLLRDPQKPVLADAIWTLANMSSLLKYKEGYRMYWMVEHSFTVSLGYVAAHIRISVHSTPIMSDESTGLQLLYLMDMKEYQQKTGHIKGEPKDKLD